MAIHINVQQHNTLERNIAPNLINKIYKLVNQNLETGDGLDETSDFIGNIQTSSGYKEYENTIENEYPEFNINMLEYYILFDDKNLEDYIKTNYIDVVNPNNEYAGIPYTLASWQDTNSNHQAQWGFRSIFMQKNWNNNPVSNHYSVNTFNELGKMTEFVSLGECEFGGQTSLSSIDLTNIKQIGRGAFEHCPNLKYFNGEDSEMYTLSLPNLTSSGLSYGSEFRSYDASTNDGCQVQRIKDLGNCSAIGGYSFAYNQNLKTIDEGVLDNITKIQDGAFRRCIQLEIDNLYLPICSEIRQNSFELTGVKSITALGSGCLIKEYAFLSCSSLTTISQEALNNISRLEKYVFEHCPLNIENLSLPMLIEIGEGAFSDTPIKNIVNLGNVSTVNGFRNCKQLTNITLPPSANTIGGGAFSGCTSLILPSNLFDTVQYFDGWCFENVLGFPSVLYLKSDKIAPTPFAGTNIRSIYLPNLLNTNGIYGKEVPGVGRQNYSWRCGSNMTIFYLKKINKINGFFFGGEKYATTYSLDLDPNDQWYVQSAEVYGRHYVDGNLLTEYKETGALRFNPKGQGTDGWGNQTYWANIKYVVINNTTPPDYWQSSSRYGKNVMHSSFSLYQKALSGANETFHYLVVPRSAINTYLAWDAFHPDFSSPNLEESDRQKFISATKFDNDDVNNLRIIALESMGHFATKAEYDAADNYPDGTHSKEEYLIEEYMGLGANETINWDPSPTWSI